MKSWLKWGVFVACGLVLLPGTPAKTWALKIIYPQDGTYVTKSNYLIVQGGEDPLLDGMTIEIGGIKSDVIDLSSEEYRTLYGDKLVVEPIFDPGENKIVVEGYLRGNKVASVQASVYFLADDTMAPPQNYRKEVFHLGAREEPCAECHNMQPNKAQLHDPNPNNHPCASCHARMLNRSHVHGPAGVYDCVQCHDSDSQPNKHQVSSVDEGLCMDCHEGQNSMPFLHGPVAVDLCVICHDAHASDQPAQMIFETNQLCVGCHANMSKTAHVVSGHPLAGPSNPAQPEKKFNCSSCHNPHGGESEYYFIDGVKSRMQLCVKCHKK